MKTTLIASICFFSALNVVSQYNEINFKKTDVPSLSIKQIDNYEETTVIHFQYVNSRSLGWICANEDFYLKDTETYKKYKLLSTYNIPICDKVHVFDEVDQLHNFSLEFEKIPITVKEFDIIETIDDGGLNIYGVSIDTSFSASNYIDIEDFTSDTPVKEFGTYYIDGTPMLYYKNDGITVTAFLYFNKDYGKYYQVHFMIENLSGREFNIDPNAITYKMFKNDEVIDGDVLSYNDYMKKVKNRQAWAAVAVAFGESMAASDAGYSSSTTSSSTYGQSNTYGSASGYVGNTYGSVYGSTSTYTSSYGTSRTNSYNGAAAYAAQQNANKNVANYQNQQFQIKKTLSDGYAKLNTIFNETQYQGYVNINYKKVDHLQFIIPINGVNYSFVW